MVSSYKNTCNEVVLNFFDVKLVEAMTSIYFFPSSKWKDHLSCIRSRVGVGWPVFHLEKNINKKVQEYWTTIPPAGILFRRLDYYSAGWMTISQADWLFFAAWISLSPRLIGPTILTLMG